MSELFNAFGLSCGRVWTPQSLRPLVWYDFIGRNYSGLQSIPDLSGNNINAMLGSTSGVDAQDPAWAANSLSFDGVDDFCTINYQKIGAFANNGDISILLRLRSNSQLNSKIAIYGRSGNWYSFGVSIKNGYYAFANTSADITSSIQVDPAITQNVAFVSSSGKTDVYYQGAKIQTLNYGVYASPADLSNSELSIGSAPIYKSYFYSGKIYSVMILKRALTPADVKKFYDYCER